MQLYGNRLSCTKNTWLKKARVNNRASPLEKGTERTRRVCFVEERDSVLFKYRLYKHNYNFVTLLSC